MYRVIWRRGLIDLLTRIYTDVFEQGGDTGAIPGPQRGSMRSWQMIRPTRENRAITTSES